MRRLLGASMVAALTLSACVTINVYFPAAEAKEAAKVFVEKVLEEADPPKREGGQDGGGMAYRAQPAAFEVAGLALPSFDPLALIGIGTAQAQSPDFNIQTPAIAAIQSRMEQRFDSQLRAHFDSGALGFTEDGLVVVRDAAAIPLKDRVPVNNAVADENRDRKAVYREIAVANGHPEWEGQIRSVFARQWVSSARSGWWYQQGGAWKQK
ncbi:MAG: YdbL family protein [Pseudomonadota bacterium]